MRPISRCRCAPAGLFLIVTALVGCGQPVREDRTVAWSPEGKAVGFQHGGDGVFVADRNGGGPRKIFQPAADVVATSSPLWGPDGKRMVFTTARGVNGTPNPFPFVEPNPAGNVYPQWPVVYTCWLSDGNQPPAKLFEAHCDHPGYVAANLAVRWHLDGKSLLYVNETGNHQHGVFQFDLATNRTEKVFPHTSAAVLFDWAPDREHLVCVLGSPAPPPQSGDGIWVGRPGGGVWWRVPGSEALAEAELPSLLERLKATRPVWTSDGRRFAFVTTTPAATPQPPARQQLRLGTLATHVVEVLGESTRPVRDLCWASDGERLGFVRGGETGTLHLVRPGEAPSASLSRLPVRRFVGWHAGGKHLAYTTPDPLPYAEHARWAFLFVADERARDAVVVADGSGRVAGNEVFAGLRVTFPCWSPREEKLSLWFTWTPTYSSWLSRLLAGGLQPGDPAALLDVATREVRWLAVNAQEKYQIGHFHLQRREFDRAWQWYQEAAKEGTPSPQPPADPGELVRRLTAPADYTFFEYYCLAKLGRSEAAADKLRQFRRSFPPQPAPEWEPLTAQLGMGTGTAGRQWLRDLTDPNGLVGSLVRDLYVAEVFLSLDAAADGEPFFREELEAADRDAVRLSKAFVLCQLLLLQGKYDTYADVAGEVVLPLVRKLGGTTPPWKVNDWLDWQNGLEKPVLGICGAATLLPLLSPEFAAHQPLADRLPPEFARAEWRQEVTKALEELRAWTRNRPW